MRKQNIVNALVTLLLVIGLIVCFFFWKCTIDLVITILAVIVIVAGLTLLFMQNKKLKELAEADNKE